MKTYMFCNAHLDPVWLWQWESGMMEGISTYRAASGFIDEYPDFVFNHNEALIYQWVEEHEPELFERIREQADGFCSRTAICPRESPFSARFCVEGSISTTNSAKCRSPR